MTITTAPHSTRRRRAPLAALATAIALAVPTSVAADPPEREVPPAPAGVDVIGYEGNQLLFTVPFGRVYGPVGGGVAVIVGGSIVDVCTGGVPPATLLAATQRGDGSWDASIPNGGVERQTWVYEIEPDEGVFDFFGRVCPEIGGGAAAPDPIAVGPTTLTSHQRDLAAPYAADTGPQPAGRYQNSVKGEVVGDDGTRYRLIARANYTVFDDGPPDFRVDALKLQPLG